MKASHVPLTIFGPQTLYQFLVDEYEELESISKRSIEQVLADNIVSFSYERAIRTLASYDLERFVNWALHNGIWPEGWEQKKNALRLSTLDLDIDLEELRGRLMTIFSEKRIWPRQDFQVVTEEALRAANQAVDALPLVNSHIVLPRRRQAIQQVQSGLDKALLNTEKIIELFIEFLSLILLHLKLISSNEGKTWLRSIGLSVDPNDNIHPKMWHQKQIVLGSKIYKTFFVDDIEDRTIEFEEEDFGFDDKGEHQVTKIPRRETLEQTKLIFRDAPDRWGAFWQKFHTLVELCQFKEQKIKEKIIWSAPENAHIMKCLENIRQCRNVVRHASSTLDAPDAIPDSYIANTRQIRDNLQHLIEILEQEKCVPRIAKVWEINCDCYGVTKITLTLPGQNTVDAYYRLLSDREFLAKNVRDGMALTQKDYEFFLFPPPDKRQNQMYNPLLIRRDYSFTDIGSIPIKNDSINRFETIRRQKGETGEEVLEEIKDPR